MYLWLFKDIMGELRDQLEFQDHLAASVRDWKAQIRRELKSRQKKIIFIGVHCRYDCQNFLNLDLINMYKYIF